MFLAEQKVICEMNLFLVCLVNYETCWTISCTFLYFFYKLTNLSEIKRTKYDAKLSYQSISWRAFYMTQSRVVLYFGRIISIHLF